MNIETKKRSNNLNINLEELQRQKEITLRIKHNNLMEEQKTGK